jgi:hypothetical protein
MTMLAQVVTSLAAAPRPILFLDTCTLLDIVRAPLRDLTMTVRAGVELRALAASGRSFAPPAKSHGHLQIKTCLYLENRTRLKHIHRTKPGHQDASGRDECHSPAVEGGAGTL